MLIAPWAALPLDVGVSTKVADLRGEVSEMKRELDRLSADVPDQQGRLAKLVTWLTISICMCGIAVLVIAIKL